MTRESTTLLVNPPTPTSVRNKEFILPPALLYLAGYLRGNGEHAALLDCNIARPWETNPVNPSEACQRLLIDKIREVRPSLLGFGCLFTGQFLSVISMTEIAKKHFPEIPIVVGGMHATLFAEEILAHVPTIDYLVLGEGEAQLLALVRHLKNGGGGFPGIQDGFAGRENGAIRVHRKQQFIEDLDALPSPAYDLVDFNDYQHDTTHWHNPKGISIGVSVPLISSRSCPCRCNFCSMYLVGGTKFRSRTAEHVVAEIEHLYTTHGVTHFSFMDDNVSLNKKRTMEMCAGIVRRDLRIQFETPNGLYVNSLDPDVIDALASAGWVRGALAIESGSDYIRNTIMKKNLSEEKIHAVVSHLRKHPQVYTKAYFIIGMPEDTAQTLENTYTMIESLDIDEPTVTNVVPFPGTELFKQCLDDGLLIDNLEVRNLWRDESFFLTNNDRFFLKPYRLSLEELQDYRKKLDQLLARKIACAKTRRASHA